MLLVPPSIPTSTSDTDSISHLLDGRLDAFKAGVRALMDRVATKASGAPSRIRTFARTATEPIKAHPIAAIGVALGLSYVAMRIARR